MLLARDREGQPQQQLCLCECDGSISLGGLPVLLLLVIPFHKTHNAYFIGLEGNKGHIGDTTN